MEKEEQMRRFFKIVYPLVVIGIGVGFLLSFTYQALRNRLLKAQENEEALALKQVFPEAKEFKKLEIEGEPYFEAIDQSNKNIGYIFKKENIGYGGPVVCLVGITNDLVAKIVITSMAKETPGLGSKISDQKWLSQFYSKKASEIPSNKQEFKEKGIDAISGATFSSLAVSRNVVAAFKTYKKLGFIVNETELDASSEATQHSSGGNK